MKEITLMSLLDLAWRRIAILIATFVVVAAGAFCYFEFLVEPQYVATSSVLLTNGGSLTDNSNNNNITTNNNNANSIGNVDIVASINIMNTYADYLKEPGIYRLLAEKIYAEKGEQISWNALKSVSDIKVRSENSLFIDITFTAKDKDIAVYYANAFSELVPDYFSETFPYAAVTITSQADRASQIYPKTISSTLASGLFAVVLAYAICLIVDFLSLSIRGEEGYVSHFSIPLLGCVPEFESTPAGNNEYNEGVE